MKKVYFIYLLADSSEQLLRVGVTDNLYRKLYQPRVSSLSSTRRNQDLKLVYFEQYPDAISIINRERQLNSMSRGKLRELVSHWNPTWENLQPATVPKTLL